MDILDSITKEAYNIDYNHLIESIPFEFSKFICDIFLNVLLIQQIPIQWKDATISPVFKSGNDKLVQNYRPISNITYCGKKICCL